MPAVTDGCCFSQVPHTQEEPLGRVSRNWCVGGGGRVRQKWEMITKMGTI